MEAAKKEKLDNYSRSLASDPHCIFQNKAVMAFGLVTVTLCVAYIGYLHAQQENKKDLYEAIDSEGNRLMKRKTSKWD
ncbi:small integral membrane protein 8 isoform X2 [Pituophis catenifer annectens]|uniref:small integral membrane protein 8 isoform X2 n=1 Tax=Pituophis catenifer annectens TaxID=94852 RepID=UPI0039964FA9